MQQITPYSDEHCPVVLKVISNLIIFGLILSISFSVNTLKFKMQSPSNNKHAYFCTFVTLLVTRKSWEQLRPPTPWSFPTVLSPLASTRLCSVSVVFHYVASRSFIFKLTENRAEARRVGAGGKAPWVESEAALVRQTPADTLTSFRFWVYLISTSWIWSLSSWISWRRVQQQEQKNAAWEQKKHSKQQQFVSGRKQKRPHSLMQYYSYRFLRLPTLEYLLNYGCWHKVMVVKFFFFIFLDCDTHTALAAAWK